MDWIVRALAVAVGSISAQSAGGKKLKETAPNPIQPPSFYLLKINDLCIKITNISRKTIKMLVFLVAFLYL